MDTLSVTGNERVAMGGNNPPAFEAHKANIDDLFDEAKHWLDGGQITTAAEAKAVDQLMDMARDAKKAADEARKVENEPFDTGKAEVQARYNPILKRADTIVTACKDILTPWNQKVAAEKAAIAEAARLEAEQVRKDAEELMRSSAGNVAAREDAEHMLNSAKLAERDAKRATKAAATGNGLRTTYKPVLTDLSAAIKYYWATQKGRFEALVIELAVDDVRAGARSIPGFDVVPEQKAV